MSTINLQFIEQVNKILSEYPASASRLVSTPLHNKNVGGAQASLHLTGNAIDLIFDEAQSLLPAAELALSLGFGGIEVDYRNNHLHLDNRSNLWHVVYTKKKQWTLKNFLTDYQDGANI